MQLNSTIIVVIEDNISIRRFLRTSLLSKNHQLYEASNGKDGIDLVREKHPNVILLDLGLPDMDGLLVIKKIREWTAIPIIVLSARDQEQDKIVALDLGADDYLTKPFAIEELHARLRVALRHATLVNENETTIFENADLKVDLINHRVWLKDQLISLSPTQFSIVAILVKRANKIVTHKQLLKEIWGDKHDNNIDYLRIYMHQLRQKLETNPAKPKYFITEPGIGYRLASV